MKQDTGLVPLLLAQAPEIAGVVARDVAGSSGGTIADALPAARAAVDWLLAELRAGGRVRDASLEGLRDQARRAAADGRPVASVLDPYLSAGWAIWEAASARPGATPSLPELGGLLLRAGDASAAVIAAAYADAEAAQAARTASARREFLDELLAARPDSRALARLGRRAAAYGLAPGTAIRAVVVATAADLDDDAPALVRLATELGPRVAIVAADRGRALVIARSGSARDPGIRAALNAALGADAWTAIAAEVEDGLAGLGGAVAAAHAALEIARRLGRRGVLEAPEATLLEQAILADRELLEHGVATALAPLVSTPRTGALLVETLRVFLETAGNRRETARRLGLAPRTVAYRLRRIEARLGVRLEGRDLLRLGAALFALALLGPDDAAEPRPADPAGPRVSPSRGRSRGPSRR
jgi:hypothetical protein